MKRITREEAPWLRVLSYHDLVNDIPEDRSERARHRPRLLSNWQASAGVNG